MSTTFPEVRVGDPTRYHSLTVFPLFGPATSEVDYQLSDEAIGAGAISVEEISEGGSVPTLLVTNTGDRRVLFLEGEELRGAKQNRVLNTSVLVAAHTKTPIPVSCVEQGRWRYKSKGFSSSDTHSSSKLRGVLKRDVARSLKEGRGHRSDQGTVWSEVSRQMQSMRVSSGTVAMSDTYESHRGKIEEFRNRIGYPEGAVGLAVAVGSKVVAVDVFDKPTTCRKAWNRLLSGVIMDALESTPDAAPPTAGEVSGLIDRLRIAPWEPAPAVGEGQEYRSDAVPPAHASSLVLNDAVVHGSVVVGVG